MNSMILLALLASTAVAKPVHHIHHMAQHHHDVRHEKRDAPVIWVTDWVLVTKTVDVTSTAWVAAPASSPSPPVQVPPSSPTSIVAAAQFYQTKSPELAASPVTSVAPQNSSPFLGADIPPAASSPASPTGKNMTHDLDVAPYAAPNVAAPPSVLSGGQCVQGSPCEGDITYYDPGVGLGSCGQLNQTTEHVVALPIAFMGSSSNSNPYCGKTISIMKDGKTTTATVVDKCAGCVNFSIDLSNAAFTQLVALEVGRTKAKWWFN